MRAPIVSKGTVLYIRFELIGYKNSGESVILSLITESEETLWCGIIDCFSYKGRNRTKSILNSYGYGCENKKINFLCISHPDTDHIYKMSEIINDYTDDNTMFLMPDFFNSNIVQTKEIKKIQEILNKRFDYTNRRDSLKNNIFFNRRLSETQLKWKFITGIIEHNLQIESITPYDSIMYTSQQTEYTQFKNDFSISLKISLDEHIYWLMGDCSDYVLASIDEEEFYGKANYLKIPHHGARNNTLQDLIKNEMIEELDVSTCTFRKNTTLEEVLDFYKNYSTILSVTGSTNSEDNKLPYGIVKHTYEAKTGELQEDRSYADGNGIFNYATWKV